MDGGMGTLVSENISPGKLYVNYKSSLSKKDYSVEGDCYMKFFIYKASVNSKYCVHK